MRAAASIVVSLYDRSPTDNLKNGGEFSAMALAADIRGRENPKLTPFVNEAPCFFAITNAVSIKLFSESRWLRAGLLKVNVISPPTELNFFARAWSGCELSMG